MINVEVDYDAAEKVKQYFAEHPTHPLAPKPEKEAPHVPTGGIFDYLDMTLPPIQCDCCTGQARKMQDKDAYLCVSGENGYHEFGTPVWYH